MNASMPTVTRAAHAATFLALARRSAAALDAVVERTRWLERLDREQDNLLAALAWATSHDLECAAELAASLGTYWIGSGRLGVADQHLNRVLALTDKPIGCGGA